MKRWGGAPLRPDGLKIRMAVDLAGCDEVFAPLRHGRWQLLPWWPGRQEWREGSFLGRAYWVSPEIPWYVAYRAGIGIYGSFPRWSAAHFSTSVQTRWSRQRCSIFAEARLHGQVAEKRIRLSRSLRTMPMSWNCHYPRLFRRCRPDISLAFEGAICGFVEALFLLRQDRKANDGSGAGQAPHR